MEAYNRFNRCIFEWERNLLKLIGHDFFGEKFQRNAMTFFVYALILLTFISAVYTLIFLDPLSEIFALICILIQIQVKWKKNDWNQHFLHISNIFLSIDFSGRGENVSHLLCWWFAVDYSFRSEFVRNSCQKHVTRTHRIFCQICHGHRTIVQGHDNGVHFVDAHIFPLSTLYVFLQEWSDSNIAIVFAIYR